MSDREQPMSPGSESAAPSFTLIVLGSALENGKRKRDWIGLASSVPVVLGAVGLIIYGAVRVGIDAFYERFGVTPEDIGLSQTTIIARGALYLAYFATLSMLVLGVVALITLPFISERRDDKSEPRDRASWLRRNAFLLVAAAAGLTGMVAAAVGVSLPVAFAVGLIIPLTLVPAAASHFAIGHRSTAGLMFLCLGVWSATVAFLLERHASEFRGADSLSNVDIVLFESCLLACLGASIYQLSQFARSESSRRPPLQRRETHLTIVAILTLSPLLLPFWAGDTTQFITKSADHTLFAVLPWAAVTCVFGVFALGSLLDQPAGESERDRLRDVLLLIASVSLFTLSIFGLERAKGIDLANQVLEGNRISQRGFSILSVRADIVCLEPLSAKGSAQFARGPFILLGQANNELFLFDLIRYETLRAREDLEGIEIGAPSSLHVSVPAGNVTVDVARLISPAAKYAVPVGHSSGRWTC
jgi:hypothetical protein